MKRISGTRLLLVIAGGILAMISGVVAAGIIRTRHTVDALQHLKQLGGEVHLACPHWCPVIVSRNASTFMANQVQLEFVGIETPLLYIAMQIKRLPQDVCLSLQDVSLTNVDLRQLCELKNVVALSVTDLGMSDQAIKSIVKMSQLKCLSIHGGQVTDRGCQYLSGHGQLEHLGLIGLPISDSGVRELSKLSHLKIVDLRGTHVTDLGLRHLVTLPDLQSIDLRNSQVTAQGVRRFRETRPGIEIQN
ncbi:MAG: F-box/LRR-repeat protein 14-like [Planctomycetaceae bacterium]|nr:F-box/LRR-repeat protein 14-like [Planctomycetaceae bacterium]